MTLDEAAKLKQAYWELESRFELSPPGIYSREDHQKMNMMFVEQRDKLFSGYRMSAGKLMNLVDFMALSQNMKVEKIAASVEKVS